MNKDGYTLVEMLAALLILGLAIGSLLQAMHVLGRIQTSATRTLVQGRRQAFVQGSLDRLLSGRGPFFGDDRASFAGGPAGFAFSCGGASPCQAELSRESGSTELEVVRAGGGRSAIILPGNAWAGFVYVGERTSGPVWPPAHASHERLLRITLGLDGQELAAPVASVRLWKEEADDCSFDVIAQSCRSVRP